MSGCLPWLVLVFRAFARMYFSSIAEAFPSALNRLYRARDAALQRGEAIADLVAGNVNLAGIEYPHNLLKEALRQGLSSSRVYQPDSLGRLAARQAVAAYYHQVGIGVPPEQLLLTPGSSLAYFYCFKLLAESGDEILCPSPSYPLFESIAQLCQVRLTAYRLQESRAWEIDLDYLESQITTRTRGIVLISPHNPTGAVTRGEQVQGLADIASRQGLPIISDEVFSEFLFGIDRLPRPAETKAPLVFTLNGFSKMLALPGIKLGWVAVTGDSVLVRRSMRTLEMISDTFLPVSEPVQFAVPELLNQSGDFLSSYRVRIRDCRDLAMECLKQCRNLSIIPPAGGFYLTAKWVGAERDEEAWVIDLLNHCRVLVHPGYFYDIPGTHLVMSFVQNREELREALLRLREYLDRLS
jgi:alanine-synthesizing transaminase